MERAYRIGLVRRLIAAAAAVLLVAGCAYWALTARFSALWFAPADPTASSVFVELLPPPLPVSRTEPESTTRPIPAANPEAPTAPSAPIPETGPPVEITQPVWIATPRHPERWYPSRAFSADVRGVVEMECLVAIDGRLSCQVLSEAPGGWEFGAAALEMSREYLMQPPTRNGAPARGRYVMRITFSQSGVR
jgi:TonB family protein